MRRSPTAAALAVVWATLGSATARPRVAASALEPLRRTWRDGADGAPIGGLTAGDPAGVRVILVHGTPGSAAGWAAYLREPPPGTEMVAIDRPGFGASGPHAARPSLAAQARALAALLPDDARAVVLVGHSLGGAVAARAAADLGARIGALVLVAASLDPAAERVHPLQTVGAWPPVAALLPRAIRNANTELIALEGELRGLAPRLERITAPVLLLHGGADPLVPAANVEYAQTRLRRARTVAARLLPGADHFLPWNAAAAVRDAIAWGVAAAALERR